MDNVTKKKYRAFLFFLLISILFLFFLSLTDKREAVKEAAVIETVQEVNDESKEKYAIPSGRPIGIYVKTDGVMVVDTGEIVGNDGKTYNPCYGRLLSGDYIKMINGVEITDKNSLINVIDEWGNATLEIVVMREGEEVEINVDPILSESNKYMIGLWVKDDISGIGTLTYIDEAGFGALGHSINDSDTGKLFTISDGAIYPVQIINIVKSGNGVPGRIEGIINYSEKNVIGRINNNTAYGITGALNTLGDKEYKSEEWLPIANKNEIEKGKAYILSWVTGEPEYYEIEITALDITNSNSLKGIEIKVTDEKLLGITSGIVQGMSGTPIIQNGKIVGAVTHVFVQDSTKGYGIFIEDMMKQ